MSSVPSAHWQDLGGGVALRDQQCDTALDFEIALIQVKVFGYQLANLD
jgi:hypothetical protein